MKHLWEVNHPYYMHEGCFFKARMHDHYDSFSDFLQNWEDSDIDMNRVHRWDWKESEDYEIEQDGTGDTIVILSVYYIMQRKAYTYSCDVFVRRSDEPKVIEFLMPHAMREAKIWNPLNLTLPESDS